MSSQIRHIVHCPTMGPDTRHLHPKTAEVECAVLFALGHQVTMDILVVPS